MKRLAALTAVISILLSVLSLTAVLADSCTCTAPDGSCSASASCQGGCIAYCASGGGCRASCTSGGDGRPRVPDDYYSNAITLQLTGVTSKQVSSELAQAIGRDIVFLPTDTKATFTFEFNNARSWEVLDTLSKYGKVRIAGEDFETLKILHQALLSGEKINVCLRKVPVKKILNELSFLTGLSINVNPGEMQPLVNMTLKGVTFKEILASISRQSGASVMVEGTDIAAQ